VGSNHGVPTTMKFWIVFAVIMVLAAAFIIMAVSYVAPVPQ